MDLGLIDIWGDWVAPKGVETMRSPGTEEGIGAALVVSQAQREVSQEEGRTSVQSLRWVKTDREPTD